MKFRFTASSISSIAISRTMMLRRLRKMPTTLIAKRIAPRTRKWESVRVTRGAVSSGSLLFRRHGNEPHAVLAARAHLLRRVLVARVLALAQRERDGGDDGHQQHHCGDLERIRVVGIEQLAELPGIAGSRRQRRRDPGDQGEIAQRE